MNQQWLTLVILFLILAIIIDGVRRMINARKDSIKMSLKKPNDTSPLDEDMDAYGSEFPNGGARPSNQKINVDKIKEVRSKYNFGDDLPNWGAVKSQAAVAEKDKKEPSISDTDLMDESVALDSELDDAFEQNTDDVETEYVDTEGAEAPFNEEVVQEEPSAVSEQAHFEDEQAPTPSTQKSATLDVPEQTSLNLDELEENVPLLMETLADEELKSSSEQLSSYDEEIEIDVDSAPPQAPEAIRSVAKKIRTPKTPPKAEPKKSDIDTFSANKPHFESKYVDHTPVTSAQPQQTVSKSQLPQEVLVINLRAPEGTQFQGSDLLEVILDEGLRFGEMDIFHRHADDEGEGPILFSMANMVKPGSFDLNAFEHFNTIGLSFFMTLPVAVGQNMATFEKMLATVKAFAQALGGDLKDENRSVLTGQTIEHYRERVRDFSRREQLEKNKV